MVSKTSSMDPTESSNLLEKPPDGRSDQSLLISCNNIIDFDHRHSSSETSILKTLFSIFLQPIQWLKMLSSELNPTFVFGVILIYGLSQGFNGSFFKVVTDYYWKDVQKVQPSIVQLYISLYYIPWIMKPIWGLFTDVFPVKGYRRRPYFVVAGVLGTLSALMVALSGNLVAMVALSCLISVSGSMAIADVTIDACIARNSIEVRSLASDLQSLCGFCSSAGALIGYSSSGFFVHHLGPQCALGLLAIPPALTIVLGFVIYENRTITSHRTEKKKSMEKIAVAIKGMYKTIKCPEVSKPSLYMFLSLALNISTHEGMFYWYTDSKAGPAFSQELVGIIHAIGAMSSMVGVLIYHKTLKNYPFRNLLFFAQLFYGISGMMDLIFILRWNLIFGIPDYLFIIMEECFTRIISRIRWIPMIVLSTRLCPLGIEGTFFALLMCIDSLGQVSSKCLGGVVLHILNVTRTNFTNLWLVIFIRNVLRFSTLALIFLVPKADQTEVLLPSDLMTKNFTINGDDDSLQLVPMNGKNEA